MLVRIAKIVHDESFKGKDYSIMMQYMAVWLFHVHLQFFFSTTLILDTFLQIMHLQKAKLRFP